jgi:glucokinase
MRVLAADVGGTKTLLSLYDVDDDGFARELRSERYASGDYGDFADIARLFLGDELASVTHAGIGVAGPITREADGRETARTTNLPWHLDARALEASLAFERVRLVNDFHAVALGIPRLAPEDVTILQEGHVDPDGPLAILGAGTGLGQAIVVPVAGRPRVLASEGGHCDFAPRNETEIALLRFLLTRRARVSVERIVSGPGICNVYDFVVGTGLAPERADTRARLDQGEGAAVIGERALLGDDPACVRAVEIFCDVYGAEAGNLALKVLPTGGLYVAGGIAPRLLPKLREGRFLEAFRTKGRMSPLLAAMRVSVVTNTRVGLVGALHAAISRD